MYHSDAVSHIASIDTFKLYWQTQQTKNNCVLCI